MYVLCFVFSGWVGELVLGRSWGFGPSSTLYAGPSFSKHFGGKGLSGCRSQGCHGYPMRPARFDSWPHPPF